METTIKGMSETGLLAETLAAHGPHMPLRV